MFSCEFFMKRTGIKEDLFWRVRPFDAEEAHLLSERLSLHPMTARLLLQRGLSSSAAAFLYPSIDLLHDPFLFPEMEEAISRIFRAMEQNEKILIYGDYDVDGITGTALLVEAFRMLGYPVASYIPDRFKEGYGLHLSAIRNARDAGTTFIITVDCGTTSHDEIREAQSLGIDMIVVDHHRLEGAPPPATAFLNLSAPEGNSYPFHGLSSVGVAFKLAEGLFKKGGLSSLRLHPLLDLVALGTIADVAPLVGENRFFVREGLSIIRQGKRPGLAALFHVAGENPGAATEQTLCYNIIPRLNAAGRLYHADEAVALLTSGAWEEALPRAERLDRYNRERQQIEAKMWEEANRQILEMAGPDRPPIFLLASEGWHPGVVGIIASRVVERYRRPAIVIALSPEGIGRGSGRSIDGIDLHQSVLSCRALLEKFGGHPGAIGLTIRKDRIELFREALMNGASAPAPVLEPSGCWVDAEIELEEITFDLRHGIEPLAPFGPAHPEPVFLGRNLSLISLRKEPDRWVRFKVRNQKGWTLDVVAPNRLEIDWDDFVDGTSVDLAFTLDGGRWQGEERIFLKAKGIRRAGTVSSPRIVDRC